MIYIYIYIHSEISDIDRMFPGLCRALPEGLASLLSAAIDVTTQVLLFILLLLLILYIISIIMIIIVVIISYVSYLYVIVTTYMY